MLKARVASLKKELAKATLQSMPAARQAEVLMEATVDLEDPFQKTMNNANNLFPNPTTTKVRPNTKDLVVQTVLLETELEEMVVVLFGLVLLVPLT